MSLSDGPLIAANFLNQIHLGNQQRPITQQKSLSIRRAAWLILQRTETLDGEQDQLLEKLTARPELSEAIALAKGFLPLVRERLLEQLDDWLKQAMNSSIKAFQNFAKSLMEDYDAVKAGVTLEVSNGQVEGQNNRLKMLVADVWPGWTRPFSQAAHLKIEGS